MAMMVSQSGERRSGRGVWTRRCGMPETSASVGMIIMSKLTNGSAISVGVTSYCL